MRKALISLLTLILVISGICFFGLGSKQALAAAGDVTTGDGYIAIEYNDLTEFRKADENIAPTHDGYIFAGWYEDAKCETAFKNVSAATTEAYAKFVPADVLSVKAQLKEDTTSESDKTNMRIISSVDSLNYTNVGFEIYYNGSETPITVNSTRVYERIVASAESGVDYNYSSKIFDVESEYFVTATLVNIKNAADNSNFNKSFFIRPYWTTLDGTVVYGMGKFTTVNNGLDKNNINMPVKVGAGFDSENASVTVAGAAASASVAHYDGTYAYLNINVANKDSALDSVSAISVSDGNITATAEYRNLMTKYDGTASSVDTSWYKTTDTKFTISTSADLYGLAKLVNGGTTLSGKTIYVTADIVVNKGRATENGWKTTEEDGITEIEDATSYVWTPIGYEGKNFAATFDGQGHTISGLNGTPTTTVSEAYLGVFGRAEGGGIRNFKLTNSYFEDRTSGTNYTGSVVGRITGNLDSVYSNAYVKTHTAITGGIAGRGHGTTNKTFENCWYDGTIIASGNSATLCGGIVGQQFNGTLLINNCLFSGSIVNADVVENTNNAITKNVGGICGGVTKPITIKNTLNSGEITKSNCDEDVKLNAVGGVIGQVTAGSTSGVTIDTVYYLNNGMTGTYKWYCSNTSTTPISGTPICKETEDIIGVNAYCNDILVKKDEWVMTAKTPALAIFADELELPENVDIAWHTGPNSTEYVICDNENDNELNVKELYGFAYLVDAGVDFKGKTVRLGGDVVLNENTPAPEGGIASWTTYLNENKDAKKWTPIGSTTAAFAGTFDGGMHTISGMYVNSTEVGAGLFANAAEESNIQNIKLTNSYIKTTNDYAGSIVAATGGNIQNVYSNAIISSADAYVGGIAGQLCSSDKSTIANCWYDGEMQVVSNAGGIVGMFASGTATLTNCLNTADISCTAKAGRLGGLVGRTFKSDQRLVTGTTSVPSFKITFNSCLNVGVISKQVEIADYLGSILGQQQHSPTVGFTNVYATKESSAQPIGSITTTAVTLVNEKDITGICTQYSNVLIGSEDWVMTAKTPALKLFAEELTIPENVNIDWFTGLDAIEYTICTSADDNDKNVAELYGLAFLSNAGVDFAGKTVHMANDVTVNAGTVEEWDVTNGEGLIAWTPIGSIETPFAGTFDGGMHTISGIYGVATTEGMGLFKATAEGSAIQNLKLTESYFASSISTRGTVGSIVGHCAGDLMNVYSSATINTKNSIAGGMIGRIWSAGTVNISNCWFAGSVYSTAHFTAGFVARIQNGTVSMDNCLMTGTVNYSHTGLGNAGGFCANALAMDWDTETEDTELYKVKLSISNSLNAGKVKDGTVNRAGSILGFKNKFVQITFTNVYATNESNKLNGQPCYIGAGNTLQATDSVDVTMMDEANMTGAMAVYANVLVDKEAWVPTEGTPELATFCNAPLEVEALPENVSVSWLAEETADGYVICDEDTNEENVAELYGFAYLVSKGKTFEGEKITMANDVTVNDVTISSLSKEARAELTQWEPIGSVTAPFEGTFDGNGHSISGLCAEGTDYIGLFAALDENSTVQNLKLLNCYFANTNKYTGSVSGFGAGKLVNIYSEAALVGKQYTGGLVGQIKNASSKTLEITNCWVAGSNTVSDAYQGGLVGTIDYGTVEITDCLCTSAMTGNQKNFMGGLIGGMTAEAKNQVDVTMTRCMSTSTLENRGLDTKITGSILGKCNVYSKVTLNSVYGCDFRTHQAGSPTGTFGQVSSADLIGQAAYYTVAGLGFDEDSNWVLVDGKTPQLRMFTDESEILEVPVADETVSVTWYEGIGNTYSLKTEEELYGFSYLSDMGITFAGKTVSLDADIDLNEGWTASESPEAATKWEPIGSYDVPFEGTFDGKNHTISGLYIDDSKGYLAMFAATGYNSTIKNFRLVNSYINQESTASELGVASIVGELRGEMSNVYSNAIVKGNFEGIAGLAARTKTNANFTSQVTIKNCWFDGKVITGENGRYIGGIVATVVRGTCNFEHVLFTGTIDSSYVPIPDGTGETTKAIYMGGILAESKANSATINMNSVVSAGKIVGTHDGSLVHALVGRVRTAAIANDGTAKATAQTPHLNLDNVFVTRDCYQTVYGVGTQYTGTKLIPAYTDADGNQVPETTEEIVSKVIVTGSVIRTSGDDRFIGYIPQSYVERVSDTEKLETRESLDFTSAWTLRTDGVPVLTCFADIVANTVISNADAVALAQEIGLTYWNADAKLTDAESYGAGNYLVTYDATDALYTGYVNALAGLGFTKYADNAASDMDEDGVFAATYYKNASATGGEWVLNITYVRKIGKIYISINGDYNSIDDNLLPVSTQGNDVISLSMVEMAQTVDAYGNSFVFKLPNGHFIVNDGGRKDEIPFLIAHLKELAGTTNGVQNPVYIDAWFFTHYHTDHMGAFAELYSRPELAEGIYLEAIYSSEPSSYALEYWESVSGNINNALRTARILTNADGSQPNIYQVHMGQRYYFNGITMDIIDTQEQHPVATWDTYNDPDKFNSSSTSYVFTFKDATGDVKKAMINGDATNINFRYIMEAFGDSNQTLKNLDIFVSAHHGHNTTASYGEFLIEKVLYRNGKWYNATAYGVADYAWANFLLNNNSTGKFEFALFPYFRMYRVSAVYAGSYLEGTDRCYFKGVDSNVVYPYNIGVINDYVCSKSDQYYTYGYEDMTSYTEANPHGTVKITFDGTNKVTIYASNK